jgi:tRNA(Ile)-lysidine synthase
MNNRGVDRDNEAGTIFPREQSPSVASTLSAIDHRDLTNHFVTAMDRLGPFEPCPHLAVAVSGGADSMALTLLAGDWAVRRGGEVLALTVDHGLRAASSTEADVTLSVLAERGISGRKLTVAHLAHGSALAARAREARYRLLLEACAKKGIPHLLLAHHRGDQVETVMMRALSSSGVLGLAGMPALLETRLVRLLRPLLDVPPGQLRAFLTERAVPWIEDPSNRDTGALRPRLRAARADPSGTGEGTQAVALAAREAGIHRATRDNSVARILAERATIRPEGYAVLTPGPIEPNALAALLRTIAGACHAPPIDRVAVLARALRPATLGGVRIVPAGRLGPGWLLVREWRAMEAPVPARRGAIWDGRFRLVGAPEHDGFADGMRLRASTLGPLGADAVRFRERDGPPSLVMHGLPALRADGMLAAVPHIGVGDPRWRLLFDPRNCAAGAPFLPGLHWGSRFGVE